MRISLHYNFAVLIVAFLYASNATGEQSKPIADEKTATACTLTMGWEPWEPYQYIDAKNQLTGFDIELISNVFEDMSCTVVFKEINWARGIVEVRSGKLDLLPHADYTEQRAQWAHFSDSYRDASQVIYVKKGSSERYPLASLEDIVQIDFRLGVGRGVFIGDEFIRLMKNPEFKKHIYYLPTDELQQYQMLQADRIDGYVRSITAMDSLRAKLGHSLNLEIHPLPMLTSKQHVMFSKKSVSKAIVENFNSSLQNIVSYGIYKDIESRFIR